jgi:hypothetical protein
LKTLWKKLWKIKRKRQRKNEKEKYQKKKIKRDRERESFIGVIGYLYARVREAK